MADFQKLRVWQSVRSVFAHHGDTESTERFFFFARSGDDDRTKDGSPPGTIRKLAGFIRLKMHVSLLPKAEAFTLAAVFRPR